MTFYEFLKKNPVLICKLDPVGIHDYHPAPVQRYQVLSEVSKTNPKLLKLHVIVRVHVKKVLPYQSISF